MDEALVDVGGHRMVVRLDGADVVIAGTSGASKRDAEFSRSLVVGINRASASSVELVACLPEHSRSDPCCCCCCCGSCCGGDGPIRRWALDCGTRAAADDLERDLNVAIFGVADPPARRILVLINPVSGTGAAAQIYERQVRPVLEDANVDVRVVTTEHAGHATEIALGLRPGEVDVIAPCGGDGIVFEVLQGMAAREDWEEFMAATALAVIPGGSGNGLAHSIGVGDPSVAAFAACRGPRLGYDVMGIWQDNRRFFAFLSLTWGLIAEVDIDSEHLRWMGDFRFTLYGLQRVFSKRRYAGRLLFLPLADEDGSERTIEDVDFACTGATCVVCYDGDPELGLASGGSARHAGTSSSGADRRPVDQNTPLLPPGTSNRSGGSSSLSRLSSSPMGSSSSLRSDRRRRLPAPRSAGSGGTGEEAGGTGEADPDNPGPPRRVAAGVLDGAPPGGWREMDDEFLWVVGTKVPMLDKESMVHPFAHFADGACDLSVITQASSCELLGGLLSLEDGSYINNNYISLHKVSAFALDPGTRGDQGQQSHVVVDGEEIDYARVIVELYPRLLRLCFLPVAIPGR